MEKIPNSAHSNEIILLSQIAHQTLQYVPKGDENSEGTEERETRTPQPLLVSFSPRDKVQAVDDIEHYQEMEDFSILKNNTHRLIAYVQSEVLRVKPRYIVDFIADKIFSDENYANLKDQIRP